MKCRHCGSELRLPFLDLGSAPPSNAYLTDAGLRAAEIWLPLRLMVCESCWLVQTEDYAASDSLFTQDYAYFSSFSSSWLEHAQQYVKRVIEQFALHEDSCLVEIAANDGYLLQYVQAAGIPCYGIEPTESTAAAARAKGIEIVELFFGLAPAKELAAKKGCADLIVANNVLAHVPDINDFVSGIAHLLKPDGVATFEFPHLLRMVQRKQFDTAYHEHYSYLSITAIERIFDRNGLVVFDVEELSTHGGSLRIFAQRKDTNARPRSARVDELLDTEAQAGMGTSMFYREFQTCAEQVKDDLLEFLVTAKRQGKAVAAYGAAAKGNTLINYAGIRPDFVSFVVDGNPAKQGKYMPGSRIPIVEEQRLREFRPDYILVLPWNIETEIMRQLEYTRAWGAKFVVAVPHLEIA